MKKFITMFRIEFRLALRSFDGVFFGLVMPLIILLIVGWIFQDKGEKNIFIYNTLAAFTYIGIAAYGLMALPLKLASYRSKKILKRLKVTAVSPVSLLLIQFSVQSVLAILSAFFVLVAAGIIFHVKPVGSWFSISISYLLGLGAIFSLGLTIASVAGDEKKAGIYCSILYFPMLLLSGTTIPFPILPEILQNLAVLSPLRHGILVMNGTIQGLPMSEFPAQISGLIVITVLGLAVSMRTFRWEYEN